MSSDSEVRVIRISALEKHPNADKLSIVQADGRPVVVRTQDWQVGDLAVYVPVDMIVPTEQPEFEFLKGHSRVRAARLRGVFSEGLLIKSRPSMALGEEVSSKFGILKFVPPAEREPTPPRGGVSWGIQGGSASNPGPRAAHMRVLRGTRLVRVLSGSALVRIGGHDPAQPS